MNKLLWVTVPGGIVRQGGARVARFRIHITPQLDGGSLASNGIEHWPPPSLLSATLHLEFARSTEAVLPPVEINPPHVRFQSGVWEAFFDRNTPVVQRPMRDEAALPVYVDHTSQKAAAIAATIATAAATEIRVDRDDRPAFDAVVLRELMNRWSDDELSAPTPTPSPPPPFKPPEFHYILSVLREHPAVLRALGLIIDLSLPVARLPIAFGLVRARWPSAPTGLPNIISPWTQFTQLVLPASTANISSGMVTLSQPGRALAEPRWEAIAVDVDVATKRFRDAARAARTMSTAALSESAPRPSLLPALRTGGISLVRRGREADFAVRRRAADANARRASMSEAVLTADDLLLGYRIDIKRQGGEWLSLHQRYAKYTVSRTGVDVITIGGGTNREEGHLKGFAAVDDGGGRLRTDEVVARWNGWSLAVSFPAPSHPSERNPQMPFRFDWDFQVPDGTLPRLRFTDTYSVRARVADIAGGGLELYDPAAANCVLEPILYRRYEPIAPPEVSLESGAPTLGPGEAIDHIVIRAQPSAGSAQALASRRVLLAPHTSLSLIERHGAVDDLTPDQIIDLVRRALAAQPGTSATEVLLPDFATQGLCVFPRREPGGLLLSRTDREWSGTWPNCKPITIELRDREEGESVLEWQTDAIAANPSATDRLVVRLAKADELSLELSSLLRPNFLDHFAIHGAALPEASAASATMGRHPMVTPARIIKLTHAVRRPLAEPSGTLQPLRDVGQTFAVLSPNPVLLGIDVNSTSKLDIVASWTERVNNEIKQVQKAPVQQFLVNRGDQSLSAPILHELGNTRYRRITYDVTAVSRFQKFYGAGEDPNAFLARGAIGPIDVLSSARPWPPEVISTRPAFAWEETRDDGPPFRLTRRRLPGRLRVELKSPWYETGDGERLGILAWNPGGSDVGPPEKLWPFLTQLGLDPTQKGAGGLLVPAPARFPGSASFTGALRPRWAMLSEVDDYVLVVPYEPWFHNDRWFADVALPVAADSSYWPFVQLAIARYQYNSVGRDAQGLSLSTVVRSEMVQLMPERTLTVRRAANSLFVALNGTQPFVGYSKVAVYVEQLRPLPGVPVEAIDLALQTSASDIPAWVPSGAPVTSGVGWRELQVPIPTTPGRVRIRIEERAPVLDAVGIPSGDERIEYSDVVVLPSSDP